MAIKLESGSKCFFKRLSIAALLAIFCSACAGPEVVWTNRGNPDANFQNDDAYCKKQVEKSWETSKATKRMENLESIKVWFDCMGHKGWKQEHAE